jgi:hypothetical protein
MIDGRRLEEDQREMKGWQIEQLMLHPKTLSFYILNVVACVLLWLSRAS